MKMENFQLNVNPDLSILMHQKHTNKQFVDLMWHTRTTRLLSCCSPVHSTGPLGNEYCVPIFMMRSRRAVSAGAAGSSTHSLDQ